MLLTYILFLFTFYSTCFAQHEYDVWYFGLEGIGLDFRSTPPVFITGTPARSGEGAANYCDPKTGTPLLGCDGASIIYDRNGNSMPNGNNILAGGGSSAQSAAIVPWPCSSTKYIIFTTDIYGYGGHNSYGSHYSVVDMTLNGGLGDVINKNEVLNPSSDEHLTVVRAGGGVDYWAIVHSGEGNLFYAYRVSSDGVSKSPVISSCGRNINMQNLLSMGQLKASPNGRKLGLAAYYRALVEIFDFDPYTGIVSNPITLQDNASDSLPYGICFSPDNMKVYVGTQKSFGGRLVQYDLTSSYANDILDSRTVVNDTTFTHNFSKKKWYGSMEIGPDGKIYVAALERWIGVIHDPNAKGSLCNFSDFQYEYFPMSWGLPNNIEGSAPFADTLFTLKALQDTITKEGIFVPILLSLQERYTDLTIYGHYVVSSVELINVSSGGQQLNANISKANGTFTIELPAGMNLQGIQLDWFFDPKRNTSSSTVIIDSVEFAGSTISCHPFTQVITLQPQCGDSILQHFLSMGGVPHITIQPNPTDNTVVIKSSRDMSAASFVMYDQLGKKVLDENHRVSTTAPISLDIRALPTGIYYLRITNDQFSTTSSVIVNH